MASNKKIKISYLKTPDYKTSLVSGVIGGLSNNGLINANFFVDRAALPEYQIVDIDDAGVIRGTPEEKKESDMIREVQFGFLVDINIAKAIVGWLQLRIKEYEERFKK